MPLRDYYKILGVAKNAKPSVIKKSYRERAKIFHPDANRGSKKSENQFKVLSEAYSILSDAKKRKEYDRKRSQKATSSGSQISPLFKVSMPIQTTIQDRLRLL